ncbi:hypothetical protein [Chryseobacterium gallinarum]|uniref:Uncharacterized protein n=1 Tax=Chryseobacterium gallinarum TaxID=1324352 RepID=A0A0G3M9M1_CHRGL|nr:hypothetical protein [Chryseobacterium gallinarum]AKK73742.1 hypothetical protein OK18_15030 [Chryseobacterium gallinarum]MCL8537511.1 hypothetical protein [Chryseobacterium gallinarum]QIY90418.1 hypothetical protein FOB44_06980 [Chryseobacterium gallinarum]
MKKLLYSFLLLSSATLFAQQNPSIRFAVANNIIGTVEMFNAKKTIVQSSKVYSSAANLPQTLKKYSFISTQGFTEYKIKNGYEGLDRISLADLNAQYDIPADTPVFIEGYEFTDTNTLVYGDILGKMEAKNYNGKKTLFISTSR